VAVLYGSIIVLLGLAITLGNIQGTITLLGGLIAIIGYRMFRHHGKPWPDHWFHTGMLIILIMLLFLFISALLTLVHDGHGPLSW
jgi:hypothetical protein